MKNITTTLLMAALVCGLSLGITSCKDDDKDDSGDDGQEQLSEEQQEQNNAAYAILDNLADLSSANDNFLAQTFEPTIGTADDGDASTRIVNTNDMETAAMRFADLVGGADINENTASYTWTDDELGSMTYTKTNDGKSWAMVDVNIKQVPHLQKIIYRSPEQADNNGKFKGTAYYRFGDVVKKVNAAGAEEYWICVRPAFGPEGKDKSHWVTIDALPKENVWTYKGSNGIDYALPTGLGDNHEHSQNFAEMLFAMCFPEEWEHNIVNNLKKIPMFHDFDKDNLKYHRRFFWERVQKAWTNSNASNNNSGVSIMQTIFGQGGTLAALRGMLKSADGLNLLTNGYSWWTKSSNKPTLYRYRFVNGADKESNMHKEPLKKDVFKNYSSVSAEVIKSKIKLNCKDDYCTATDIGWSVPQFFGTASKHYIIRHATGAELSTDKKEDPKEPLKGVTEIYRYNKYYDITDLSVEPETFDEGGAPSSMQVSNAPTNGEGTYLPGDVVEDEEGSRWFCIAGSPYSNSTYPMVTDRNAWFISFDGVKTNNDVATNIVKEEDLPELCVRLGVAMNFLSSNIMPSNDYKLDFENNSLGVIGKHILDYAGVDLLKMFNGVDSTWTVVNYADKKVVNSRSFSLSFNIAYVDGQTNRQAIARIIYDQTQAGNQRGAFKTMSGKHFDSWRLLCYKHYETYNPSLIELTADEASVQMTKWQALWPMTNDKITLQDAADQTMVNKYGSVIKWQKYPRTVAESSISPEDCLWKNGKFATDKRSIFNEPVLFLRFMKVEDKKGKTPNLISTDNRRLSIVHLQNDKAAYKSENQSRWVAMYISIGSLKQFYIDNQSGNVPAIAGLDIF